MADRIADLLRNSEPMTAPQIQAYFAVSDNHTRVVLTEMRAAGRVTGTKGPRGVFLWAINEGAI
jgi:DNA-binding IscR family transcriptional regulator